VIAGIRTRISIGWAGPSVFSRQSPGRSFGAVRGLFSQRELVCRLSRSSENEITRTFRLHPRMPMGRPIPPDPLLDSRHWRLPFAR